jgi:arginine-tRNA-protein transferase
VDVLNFKPNRSQKRAWQIHQQLVSRVGHLGYFEEHYQLYQDYQRDRHSGGGMDHDDQDQYKQFLLQSKVNSRLIEFRDGPEAEQPGKLRIVSIIDVIQDGLSSVYTFFDPSLKKASLGTYSVLWQIEQARLLQLPYVYLGYYIKESPKMSYKANFQPLQVYIDNLWQAYDIT